MSINLASCSNHEHRVNPKNHFLSSTFQYIKLQAKILDSSPLFFFLFIFTIEMFHYVLHYQMFDIFQEAKWNCQQHILQKIEPSKLCGKYQSNWDQIGNHTEVSPCSILANMEQIRCKLANTTSLKCYQVIVASSEISDWGMISYLHFLQFPRHEIIHVLSPWLLWCVNGIQNALGFHSLTTIQWC